MLYFACFAFAGIIFRKVEPGNMSATQPFLSKLIRWPLSLIPNGAQVRVLRGPLRGQKWIVGAGPNACWIGNYEVAQLRSIESALGPGAVFYDVGANVGVFTLLAGTRVGAGGCVCSFEPLPRNLHYLRLHVALNHLQNCVVFDKAVCDRVATLQFSAKDWEPSMARLSPRGELSVTATTLDACVYGDAPIRPPNVVKIDVEGAELDVLKGAMRTLSEFHPTLFIEVHGEQLHWDCHAFLEARGYKVEDEYGRLRAIFEAHT